MTVSREAAEVEAGAADMARNQAANPGRQEYHAHSQRDPATVCQSHWERSGDSKTYMLRSSADLQRTSDGGSTATPAGALPLTSLLSGVAGDETAETSLRSHDWKHSQPKQDIPLYGDHHAMHEDHGPKDEIARQSPGFMQLFMNMAAPSARSSDNSAVPASNRASVEYHTGSSAAGPRQSGDPARASTGSMPGGMTKARARRSSFAEFFGFHPAQDNNLVPEQLHNSSANLDAEGTAGGIHQRGPMGSRLNPNRKADRNTSMPSQRQLEHTATHEMPRSSAPISAHDESSPMGPAPYAPRARRSSILRMFSRGPDARGPPEEEPQAPRNSRMSRRASILTLFATQKEGEDFLGDETPPGIGTGGLAQPLVARKSRRASMMDLFRSNTHHALPGEEDRALSSANSQAGFFRRSLSTLNGQPAVPGHKSRRRSVIDIFGESSKRALASLLGGNAELPDEDEVDDGPEWYTSLDFFKPLSFRYAVGGYWEAWFACSKKTGEHHILKKFFKDRMTAKDSRSVRRALAFAQMLDHPNIIKCLGTWEDDECLFVVEEYAAKGDVLQDMLSHPERYTERFMALNVVKPLLEVLVYIHGLNIVHRALFPEYIFFGKDNHLRVGHFTHAVDQRLDPPFERTALLDYMAPEMLAVRDDVDDGPGGGAHAAPFRTSIMGMSMSAPMTHGSGTSPGRSASGALSGPSMLAPPGDSLMSLVSPSYAGPAGGKVPPSPMRHGGLQGSPSFRADRRGVRKDQSRGPGMQPSAGDLELPWSPHGSRTGMAAGPRSPNAVAHASPVRRKSQLEAMDAPWLRPLNSCDSLGSADAGAGDNAGTGGGGGGGSKGGSQSQSPAGPRSLRSDTMTPSRRKSQLSMMDAPWLMPQAPAEEPPASAAAAQGKTSSSGAAAAVPISLPGSRDKFTDPRALSELPASPLPDRRSGCHNSTSPAASSALAAGAVVDAVAPSAGPVAEGLQDAPASAQSQGVRFQAPYPADTSQRVSNTLISVPEDQSGTTSGGVSSGSAHGTEHQPPAVATLVRTFAKNLTLRIKQVVGTGAKDAAHAGNHPGPQPRALEIHSSHEEDEFGEYDEEAPGTSASGPMSAHSAGGLATNDDLNALSMGAHDSIFVPHNPWEWQPRYDEKVDVWQVGCLMHEVLCGCLPFEAEDKLLSAALILWADIVLFPDTLSPECGEFIKLCLVKDPSQRPSAAKLLEDPWIARQVAGEELLSVKALREMAQQVTKATEAQKTWLERSAERMGVAWMLNWHKRNVVAPVQPSSGQAQQNVGVGGGVAGGAGIRQPAVAVS